MSRHNPVSVAAAAARTTTGNSGAVEVQTFGAELSVLVNVTATGGTPSMTLSVEWSHDGTTFAAAETPDAFTAITTTGAKVKVFTIKGNYYRLVWTITGTTPSFTFSLSAIAV